MSGTVLSTAEMVDYMKKLELTKEALRRLGRGSQQEASYDIRVAASMVSSVLRGRYVDDAILNKLLDWATVRLAEQVNEQVAREGVPAEA